MAADEPLPEPDRVEGAPHPRETQHLFGQGDAERQVLDAWHQDRLHHAWLLRGPSGIGKATLAYRVARALIAQPADTGGGLFGDAPAFPATLDHPEHCPVQARIEARAEPRLFVLRRSPSDDGKRMRQQIAVEDVRRMRRFLNLSATDGGKRVIIVDSADDMNRNSANALLKYLEEPPPDCVFLLVCHAPAGLLPTIRSRCRMLDLHPLGADDMGRALAAAGGEMNEADARTLGVLVGGSAGQALRLAANDGVATYAKLVDLFSAGRGIDRAGMTQLAELCAGRNAVERYHMVITLLQTLVARCAKAAAMGGLETPAVPAEAALIGAVASDPAQAGPWAEALQHISASTRHALAVNLDPAQTIVDTLLELDAALARVKRLAARPGP